MTKTTIRARLIKTFSIAILIPSLITALVAVQRLRSQVFEQAQHRVTSDLEAAKEIYRNHQDRLLNTMRIHGTRRVLREALEQRQPAGLRDELEAVRRAEHLDVLTVLDAEGRVFYRTRSPSRSGDPMASDPVVAQVLARHEPHAATMLRSQAELEVESAELARRAFMGLTPTPRAAPTPRTHQTAGMMMEAAAPIFTPDGQLVGILLGGVLLNRNFDIVDKVTRTVFKHEQYEGRVVGTATIFQDDVRISTNVTHPDGTRAIATRASDEVARAVLGRGETWRGRAFVVNDWYISAYEPIRDTGGQIIGMLYVGTLERPYVDILWRHGYVLLGIALGGMLLTAAVAVALAQRISRPLRSLAQAAERVANGDYTAEVQAQSQDEVGHLTASFNRMTRELSRAHRDLRTWGEELERKVEQRTEEIRQIQLQMLQAEKLASIGKLAAGIAHEINNPLTGVLTNASLLRDDTPADDRRREDLQTIVDETMRCRKIVKGLLEFARQAKPQTVPLDVNDVVDDVLGLVRNQASFRNIAVESDLGRGLPAVLADRDQLRQVVLNIVLNASEAMLAGGRLHLATRADVEAGQVRIDVTDTGPGIPAEILSHVFEPFFTTKQTGTGLGLAIAYGIVQEHGGQIRIDSRPGAGSTVAIVLPAAKSQAPPAVG